MKKLIVLVLLSTCLLGLVGCSAKSIDKTKPVFKTENIKRIIFHVSPNDIEVPYEYMEKISSWLGTFTIGEEVKDGILAPGSNCVSVRIEYSNGTAIENGLTTVEVNGTTYYMKYEEAPDCYLEIVNEVSNVE